MLKTFLNLFKSERAKNNLPILMNDVWFSGARYCNEKYPPLYDENGVYINYTNGDIVPMKDLPDGKVAYYRIVTYKYRNGDWLHDSDGYRYNLKFSHIK